MGLKFLLPSIISSYNFHFLPNLNSFLLIVLKLMRTKKNRFIGYWNIYRYWNLGECYLLPIILLFKLNFKKKNEKRQVQKYNLYEMVVTIRCPLYYNYYLTEMIVFLYLAFFQFLKILTQIHW